ncbi:circularly permuted type 2 ATP-grasp protein [Pseudomonas sp. CNPSo 3701]|uniref:circularly permuted type 2 ATP-grasp protein n=1 Tax=Pseudomonas sp. CNPSo 3701 TaxID=3027943 RepID=UPI002363DDFC|nr:circularly permuted type 2 ATP-grasp protein [Pseudomonas sp. CNPSo 3701]MDD1509607.1 circularly permuted type 2 ATP-grasp protein [Pseudomonas sp. CNPSo 3701]
MPDLLAGYLPDEAAYDELLDRQGQVRPHWRPVLSQLRRNTPAQLQQRQAMVTRQIQANGVTYNVYADPDGADRPWELDLLPNLIPAAEWQTIAAGVAQRAGLLNKVLADLYGPQHLLAEGLLPPELVFGHESFLWPCQGVQPPGSTFLHLYAVDLARSADGRWQVVADRTQAPAGAGFALENRQIISRAFPELYRDLGVQHLAGFFRTLQDTLTSQAPAGNDTPLVVVLTAGRFNESYFEHLYLARQLGYPLVEGSDLTVRDATLYLKTLAGLQRVHAVLRRLDDDFCDPLELRSDSALGVPGLLEVVRQGRVLVANALGSGLLESPGLSGFLPAVSERLLGEPLLLPGIDSVWCGEPPVLAKVLEDLPNWLIRPCSAAQRLAQGRNPDAEHLRQQPEAYVAQASVQLSRAPVWFGEAGVQPRVIGMRVFAVASGDGYRVMPGGLTRAAVAGATDVMSMQSGGVSKDTWVLGERQAPSEQWQGTRALGAADLVRSDPYLPSRVVENLFWFGRYSERCEDNARLLRIMLARYVDDDDDPRALQAMFALAETLGTLPDEAHGSLEARLREALLGSEWPASVRVNLQRLQWTAGSVRGKLSQANWQAMVELQRDLQQLECRDGDLGQLLDVLNRLMISLAALSGFALDDMTRDEGWRFLMIGRCIERVQFLCDSIGGFLRIGASDDAAALDWLLELGNSSITYRTRYMASAQLIPVLDLLLLDERNPHAVVYQLRLLLRALKRLAERFEMEANPDLAQLERRLSAFDLHSLEDPLFGAGGIRAVLDGLAGLLADIGQGAGAVSEQLSLRFFAHVAASQGTQSS